MNNQIANIKMSKGSKGNFWEVQAIVGMKVRGIKRETMYEVKWKGFESDQNTWEPERNLITVKDMIEKFHKRRRSQAKLKTTKNQKLQTQQTMKRAPVKVKKIAKRNRYKSHENKLKCSKNILDKKSQKKNEIDQPSRKLLKAGGDADRLEDQHKRFKKTIIQSEDRTKQRFDPKSLETNIEVFRESNRSMDIQEGSEQENDEDIEEILLNCTKIEETTIFLKDNRLCFQIPYRKNGVARIFEIDKEQIVKINPEWLNTYFTAFLM